MGLVIDKVLGKSLSHNHSANDVSSVTDKNFVTDAQLSILNNTSGTNTGDQDLSGYQTTSQKGVSNGYASLDSAGKVPIGQLPSSIMSYQGTWDASTNTPTLADGVSNSDDDIGNVYRVTVAGSQDLGSGSISFSIGDYVILNASKVWEKSDTTDSVASVFGRTGVVTAQTNDYTWSQIDKTTSSINDITTKTHNLLTGLDSDDHTQYALLAGRSGGQNLIGGIANNNVLTLQGNSGTGNTATNKAIRLLVGNSGATEAATVLNNGNVGIGTTNPDYKLDVNGTFRANTTTPVFGANTLTVPATGTAALLETAQTFTGVNTFNDNIISNSAIAVGLSSPLMPLHLQADGSGGASVAAFDFDNGFVSRIFELRTGSSGSSIGWDTNSFFSFGTIAAHNQSGLTSTYMRIDNTGNVGIGTTSPTAKLQVSGNLALVDGMSEPSTITGYASIYVDSADGDLKVKFGDGTVKTISTDT